MSEYGEIREEGELSEDGAIACPPVKVST